MKRLFTISVMTVASSMAIADNVEYDIKGVVADSVKEITISVNGSREPLAIIPVTNGSFTAKGTEEEGSILSIGHTAGQYTNTLLIVNDGQAVSLDFTKDEVIGSQLNNQLAIIQKSTSEQDTQMMELMAQWKTLEKEGSAEAQAKKAEVEKELNAVEEAQLKDILEYIDQHRNDVSPACFISSICYSMEYDELKSILNENVAYYNHPMSQRARMVLHSLEKRRPGLMYTDLTMNDPDGNERKLSEWAGKGNYVLVDFWASWCGPCRMEMPNVLETYTKYKEKGYEVVGVSFDSNASAWKDAIKALGLTWPHISDLKGWQCIASDIYGVKSIPSNILLDPKGKIVEVDLRGVALKEKLAEIYGF